MTEDNLYKKYKKHAQDFYIELNKRLFDTYEAEILSDEDKKIVEENVYKYYPLFFYLFHGENGKLSNNPDLAVEFNFAMTMMFINAISLVFAIEPEFPEYGKEFLFETIIKSSGYKLYSIQKTGDEFELANQIRSFMISELEELTKGNYDWSDAKLDINSLCHLYTINKISSKYNYANVYKNQKTITGKKNLPIAIFRALCVVTLISPALLSFIVKHFSIPTSQHVLTNIEVLLYLPFIIVAFIVTLLLFIKKITSYFKKPDKIEEDNKKFGISIISISISEDLLPEFEEKKISLSFELKNSIKEKFGFSLPEIKIEKDNSRKGGFRIFIREEEVFDADANFVKAAPKVDKNQKQKTMYPYLCPQRRSSNTDLFPYELLKACLEKVVTENLSEVLTLPESYTLFRIGTDDEDAEMILNKTDIRGIKEIFVKIILKGGNLADITFIMDNIIQYFKTTTDIEYISGEIARRFQY